MPLAVRAARRRHNSVAGRTFSALQGVMKRSISRLPSSVTGSKTSVRALPAVSAGDALLGFERLLAELSARFINLPPEQVDDAITDALRQIVMLLDVDRSQLIRFAAEAGVAQVTH